MVSGNEWAGLASVPEPERRERMVAALGRVLEQDESQRIATLRGMVEAEYALDDESLRSFTASRLRAWIALSERDMEQARTIARGYDAVFAGMTGTLAMRRSSTVQTVVRTDFTAEEIDRLFELIPSMIQQMPRRVAPMERRETPQEMRDRRAATRPWWKFWERG
jgi:AcrR family transcriptional regulator